jgi:hypothetical protein
MKAVTWRKLRFHDIVIRNPPYSTTGYVHAVILDSSEMTEGHNVSPPSPGSIIRERARTGQQERSNGLPTNAGVSPEAGSIPGWLRERISEPDPPQQDVTTLSTGSHPKDAADCNSSSHDDEFEELSGQVAQISISHDGAYATAVCLAAEEPIAGDVGGEIAARNL